VRSVRFRYLVAAAAVVASASAAAQPRLGPVDMAGLLARVGQQVEHYFNRAQSVICREMVRVQSLGSDLLGDGSRARQVTADLRIAWQPASDGSDTPEAIVLREVLTVNGRPPRPRDDEGCMDPKPVSPEPLAMLLPGRQRNYEFTWAGVGRVDGRSAAMIDYRSLETGPTTVTRHENCVSIELPGKNRGRVWIDQETGDVLRLDERLTGMFDIEVPPDPKRRWQSTNSWTIERADMSIRYKLVSFRDPDETLMLPASIDTVTVIRNAGVPRVRRSQTFSDYRRFVTEGRIVQE
jgi:hypothetical protein